MRCEGGDVRGDEPPFSCYKVGVLPTCTSPHLHLHLPTPVRRVRVCDAGWFGLSCVPLTQVLERIGSGSFGEVLKAVHTPTGAVVALKKPNPCLEARRIVFLCVYVQGASAVRS
jgi:hypothetical protein